MCFGFDFETISGVHRLGQITVVNITVTQIDRYIAVDFITDAGSQIPGKIIAGFLNFSGCVI